MSHCKHCGVNIKKEKKRLNYRLQEVVTLVELKAVLKLYRADMEYMGFSGNTLKKALENEINRRETTKFFMTESPFE